MHPLYILWQEKTAFDIRLHLQLDFVRKPH